MVMSVIKSFFVVTVDYEIAITDKSSVFCSALGELLKIPNKKLSPNPMYTHFENF